VKRLGLIGAVVVTVVVMFYRPATSQDNYDERISGLETRVAVLESGTPTAATVTIYGVVVFGDVGVDSILANGDAPLGQGLTCYYSPPPGVPRVGDLSEVVVRDESGTIVATSVLFPGIQPPAEPWTCVFTFRAQDVPRSDFYTIEVAGLPPTTVNRDDVGEGNLVEIFVGTRARPDGYDFLTPDPIVIPSATP